AVYAERDGGQISDRDVTKFRVSGSRNIRVEGVADLRFYQGESTVHAVSEKPVFGRQLHQQTVLYMKKRVRHRPGRAGDKVAGGRKLLCGEGPVPGKRMSGRADAGGGGKAQLLIKERR